jgi:hypothetical protein
MRGEFWDDSLRQSRLDGWSEIGFGIAVRVAAQKVITDRLQTETDRMIPVISEIIQQEKLTRARAYAVAASRARLLVE